MCVCACLQLTQKKTKLEFKTLDCTMSTPNAETGQKTAVTYRCADIDKMVPSLMGVSKVRASSQCTELSPDKVCICTGARKAHTAIPVALGRHSTTALY